jgi:hypothetical protein
MPLPMKPKKLASDDRRGVNRKTRFNEVNHVPFQPL